MSKNNSQDKLLSLSLTTEQANSIRNKSLLSAMNGFITLYSKTTVFKHDLIKSLTSEEVIDILDTILLLLENLPQCPDIKIECYTIIKKSYTNLRTNKKIKLFIEHNTTTAVCRSFMLYLLRISRFMVMSHLHPELCINFVSLELECKYDKDECEEEKEDTRGIKYTIIDLSTNLRKLLNCYNMLSIELIRSVKFC